MNLQAAILDWAGTTVDFGSRAPVRAFVELFRRHAVDVTEQEARGPMGSNKRDHIRRLLELPRIGTAWQQTSGGSWDEATLDTLYVEFIDIQVSVLAEHSALIPGVLCGIGQLRAHGMKIGTTSGYNAQMMEVVTREAARQGYTPDCTVSSDMVPKGRPAPWMALHAAMQMNTYPVHACIKVGDTIADIYEGRNAGMWCIGLTRCGNELGLSEAEANALPAAELAKRLTAAESRLRNAGAHYVLPDLAAIGPVLDEINARLARGEKP